MRPADLDRVAEVERRAQQAPWSRQIFIEELARPYARVTVACARSAEAGDVEAGDADAEGPIVAFCNTWMVADEVHVLNVATDPDARRAGHAAALLEHVIADARGAGCRRVTLEVRRKNPDAIRLYRRLGFLPIAIRPNYYVDDGADAVVMVLELDAPGAPSGHEPQVARPEDSP